MKEDKKKKRREMIMSGLRVKSDCFAYDKKNHTCTALRALYCAKEECTFYKTPFERCNECKTTRTVITCEECKKRQLK